MVPCDFFKEPCQHLGPTSMHAVAGILMPESTLVLKTSVSAKILRHSTPTCFPGMRCPAKTCQHMQPMHSQPPLLTVQRATSPEPVASSTQCFTASTASTASTTMCKHTCRSTCNAHPHPPWYAASCRPRPLCLSNSLSLLCACACQLAHDLRYGCAAGCM